MLTRLPLLQHLSEAARPGLGAEAQGLIARIDEVDND